MNPYAWQTFLTKCKANECLEALADFENGARSIRIDHNKAVVYLQGVITTLHRLSTSESG